MKKKILCGLFGLLSVFCSHAQLTGSYNVPMSYTSVAAAISDLNSLGVSSSVTIDIAAGYTETVTAGGFTLNAIAGASSTNRIVFRKSGTGANPILYAYANGAGTPATAVQDGVWRLVGADYITIDGIDITDPNTTNPATMEFGYGLFKASAADGCQDNIIQNCVITLQRVNSVAGSGPSIDGSKGISLINATPAANITAVSPTVAAGSNSNNKFYGNTILHCHIGICMIGFADSSPFSFADKNNDVGGSSAVTGNTVTNFGGGGTTASAGVSTLAQYSVNVSYNAFNSNNGSGANHAGILRGIFLNTAVSAAAVVSNNTITLKSAGTTQVLAGIQNASGSTAASNTIAITNNLITNCSYPTATTGDFSGILNSSTAAALNISGNTFSNNVMKATSGFYYNVNNTGAVTTFINISNNLITNNAYHPTTGVLRGISNSGSASTATVTINGNTLQAMTSTVTGTGVHSFILNSAATAKNEISSNTAVNISFATSGTAYFINNSNSTPLNVITGNYVTGTLGKTAGGILYGYYNFGSPGSGTATIIGNNISNVNVTGATTFYGLYQATSVSQVEVVTNNTVSNVSGGTDPVYGIYHSYGANGSSVSSNTVAGIKGAGILYGITTGNVAGTQVNVNNNAVNSFTTSGASAVYGIYQLGGTTTYIFRNKLYDLSGTNAGSTVHGIFINAGTTTGVFNNMIGDLRAPAAASSNAISGIYLNGGSGIGVYFNTVHLNAVSSSSLFGTSALFASITPSVDLKNNIFHNVSVPTGTGVTAAHRRSAAGLTTFSVGSNYNSYYAGTPGSVNLIFTDGTSSYQTLSAYQTAVTNREVSSISEDTPFLSLSGSSASFLHIDPTVASLTDNGAINVPGITDDFDGQIRHGNSGYSGSGTAPDIGADEFDQNLPVCSGANAANISALSLTACTGQPLTATSSGFTTGSGITYQWMVSSSQAGPYTNVSGGSNPNHHAYTTSALGAGTHYLVMVTSCSVGPVTATSNVISYTINPTPSATITAPSGICLGSDLFLFGSTDIGTSYQWSGPNSFTSASQNALVPLVTANAGGNYSLVTVHNGCSSAAAVFSVTVSQATVNITNLTPSLCTGNSTTLTAVTAAGNYTWSSGANTNPLVISPTVTTVYDVTVSNTYSCIAIASTTVAVVDVTISATNASACASASGTLGVNAYTPSTVNWFASNSSTLPIGTGSTFTMSANTNSTVYAEASSANSGSLFTNVAGTSAFIGEMFDVVALKSLVITGFGAQFAVGAGTIEIWYRPGTHVGFSTSNAGWTLASSTTLTSNGTGVLTPIPATLSIPMSMGQTYGFYIVANTGPNVRYSGGTAVGNVYGQNADIQILEGTTGNTYFSATTSPRAFNGSVHYEVPGCTSPRIPVTLAVSPLPVVTVTQSAASVCYSTQATFTANGASTYTWVNGPVSNTFAVNPVSNSVFTVEATSLAGCTASATASISVNALPVVTISPASATVCALSLVSFTASGANTYLWNATIAGATFTDVPSGPTVYSVTGIDNQGCLASATVAVSTNSLPVVAISPASATVCSQSPVSFTASGADTYSWNNNTTSGPVFSGTPQASVVYTVEGTSTDGCKSFTTVAVTTNSLPVVSVMPPSASVCVNSAVTFSASGASSYSWTGGPATNTMIVTPASGTSYTVTGTDLNGCIATGTAAVITYSLPILSVSQTASVICASQSVILTATGAVVYDWSDGGTTATLTLTPTLNTVLTVTGTSSEGCKATSSATISVNPLPEVTATVGSNTVCLNDAVVLTAGGASNYLWSPGSETTAVITITATANTQYVVTGTDANSCLNTATVSLVVDACTGIRERSSFAGLLTLYPNPTNGVLNIDFGFGGVKQILISNSVGAVVVTERSEDATFTADLSTYAKGIYFVQVSDGLSSATFKVVLQ